MATYDLTPFAAEEWRPVVGFEGRYEVSNLGRVRSIPGAFKNHAATVLAPKITRAGYLAVTLYDGNGGRRSPVVHSLVARAFIGERPDGLQINHKDGNKTNASVKNLEYITASENTLHAFHVIKTKGMGDLHPLRIDPSRAARGDNNGSRLHPESRPKGSGHANAVITERDVLEMRSRYVPGRPYPGKVTLKQLAREYGIDKQTVWAIVHRRSWKHI